MEYSIFKTKWGYFGLLGRDGRLCRSILPMADRSRAVAALLTDPEQSPPSTTAFEPYQRLICAYFEGDKVDFSRIPVDLSGFGAFEQAVLRALRDVKHGRTTCYTELAQAAGNGRAVRAAANAVAKNPLPLILPCHRIIRKDGSMGGFSAPGGVTTKKRLLELEQ